VSDAPGKASHGGGVGTARRLGSLDLVRLTPLMELTIGTPEITIGLIDWPVAREHPALNAEELEGNFRESNRSLF
jgi:hypothetical protein